MVGLDLDELPSLVCRGSLIARSRYASRSFLRGDHLFDETQTLDFEVRELIQRRTGIRPSGPILLVTQLRCFGYYFSPLNLYYVFSQHDRRYLEFVLAEVNNTPWGERHCYVLWDGNRTSTTGAIEYRHPKEFHVSPFMGMNIQYCWKLTIPNSSLTVQLATVQDGEHQFDARMMLRRHALSRSLLRRMTLRYPLMTVQISASIYYQALKLWWKKCPFHTHPRKQNDSSVRARPSTDREQKKSTVVP